MEQQYGTTVRHSRAITRDQIIDALEVLGLDATRVTHLSISPNEVIATEIATAGEPPQKVMGRALGNPTGYVKNLVHYDIKNSAKEGR